MPKLNPSFICSDVRVRSLVRATRFYRALGLRPVDKARMDDGTEVIWLADRRTGQLLELFHLSRRSPLYRPFHTRSRVENSLIFSLPDVGPLIVRLLRLGARRLLEFEDGDVRLTFVRDPDGALIEFVSWTAAARKVRQGSPMSRIAAPGRRRTSRLNK